ncbi:hypothetical protein M409DRAFT_25047 [Zasmidium cellare ATCC 36951]|uniref:Glycosyl transferase CAP10 domain-containing protein n=1 Tax=Zasmidium cellare ATCC 36951 TaxID=1080233 RepID=A0A6A6CD38_ZASCE|nr:uncharacterized protein M409DRAFT_25047 [Zasmidium cellare ATCC 36951]KAF2164653.1 hypothetical protein M409DRAFT_25047 [Zasmidium cellare ATCC 36951]
MRTVALYGTIFILIAGALIFFATSGKSAFASEYVGSYRPEPQEHESHGKPKEDRPGKHNNWHFDYKRDGRNYGLSEEQCDIAFPGLYKEIDRAVAHRLEKWGKITPDEVEVEWRGDGIVRAMIHDNQLYIVDPHAVTDHNHRPRTISTLNAIHRAITAYPGKLPDIEFSFTVHDFALHDQYGKETTWAYTRRAHQEKLWLMPDFGLWAWPDVGLRSYAELQEVLEHEEDEFVDKVPKLVWRGSLAVGSKDVRHGLVEHSEGKPWSDVQTLDWSNKTNIEERLLTMQDHCSYMFVAQTEGNTYSGRLKYLLNCHSILFSHELEWIELYHHLMKKEGPDQNYIQVKRDFSDLPGHMKKLSKPANFPESQKIADNARRTFRERYLTPAAEACYWRAMIRGWASVQGFTPEFWVEVKEFDKVAQKEKKKRKPRGAPFEAYAIMEEVDWAIPAKARKMCIDE